MHTITQLIKSVNNTELGKGSTHEYYIQVPNEVDVSDMLRPDEPKAFICRSNISQHYEFRLTCGREKRIVGMGDFYRDFSIEAGDEVVLERSIDRNLNESYFVDYKKKENSIVLQKLKDGFEILTPSKRNLIDEETRTNDGCDIKLSFMGMERKRADSPIETECYAININGSCFDNKAYQWLEIEVVDHVATLKPINTWKMIKFQTREG